jgi:hypothetical protein
MQAVEACRLVNDRRDFFYKSRFRSQLLTWRAAVPRSRRRRTLSLRVPRRRETGALQVFIWTLMVTIDSAPLRLGHEIDVPRWNPLAPWSNIHRQILPCSRHRNILCPPRADAWLLNNHRPGLMRSRNSTHPFLHIFLNPGPEPVERRGHG